MLAGGSGRGGKEVEVELSEPEGDQWIEDGNGARASAGQRPAERVRTEVQLSMRRGRAAWSAPRSAARRSARRDGADGYPGPLGNVGDRRHRRSAASTHPPWDQRHQLFDSEFRGGP